MHQRQAKLLNLVHQKKRVAVNMLAVTLGVSEVTIRKDLNALQARGFLAREHGYAVLKASDDIGNHLSFNYDLKRAIARRASAAVRDGETLMIESGSCCTLLAEELALHRRDITIITNSAFLADFVRKLPAAHVILLGGEYQNESQVMVGPMVRQCAQNFTVDKMFLGTDGFTPSQGFMSNDLMRAEAIRVMAEKARHAFVLTESEKFTQTGVVPLLPLSSIAAVYTDEAITSEAVQHLQRHAVALYTVPMQQT